MDEGKTLLGYGGNINLATCVINASKSTAEFFFIGLSALCPISISQNIWVMPEYILDPY
jgi:hypothetical protein